MPTYFGWCEKCDDYLEMDMGPLPGHEAEFEAPETPFCTPHAKVTAVFKDGVECDGNYFMNEKVSD